MTDTPNEPTPVSQPKPQPKAETPAPKHNGPSRPDSLIRYNGVRSDYPDCLS